MRWLVLQSAGEHNGSDGWTPNHYLRECFAIQHAVKQCGHDCDVWGKRHANFASVPDFESYDVLLYAEQYEMDWLPKPQKLMGPIKIQWIVDLHCHNQYAQFTEGMHFVLHATRSYLQGYQSVFTDQKHIWFPNAIDDRYFKPRHLPKKHDLIFVGSLNPAREAIIQYMQKHCRMEHFFITGEHMLNAISKARIHFNKNIGPDLNYRVFETIGLGACLLTDWHPDMEDLGFVDGVNCLCYKTPEEAVVRVKMGLPYAWELIAAGAEQLAPRHTYTQRIRKLMEIL